MELYSHVRIKATGQTGNIIEKGSPHGELLYLIELDNAAEYDNTDDALPTCREDEIESCD